MMIYRNIDGGKIRIAELITLTGLAASKQKARRLITGGELSSRVKKYPIPILN